MMHGADPSTPVTLVENASRADQRIVPTTLSRLYADLSEAELNGPAITLYGLASRAAQAAAETFIEEAL